MKQRNKKILSDKKNAFNMKTTKIDLIKHFSIIYKYDYECGVFITRNRV